MNKTRVLISSLLVGVGTCAATGWAQPGGLAAPSPPDTVFFNVAAAPSISFTGPLDIVGGAGSVPGAVVAGKPYSADSITESTQVLADGNRITQHNEARVFRDSQGRTRLEQTLGGVGAGAQANEPVTLININDPISGASYTLDARTQTARQFRPFKIATGEMASWSPAVAAATGLGVPVPGQRVTGVRGGVVGAEPFNLPLPPPLSQGGGIAQMMPATTFASVHTTTFIGPFASATEDLGDQIIEGVLTHGTRQTQTIAAGLIGNERTIEIIAEHWYSVEIEATVLRRNLDPRFGETVYRLVNLVRGEPSPDLFVVPQGYELVVDSPPQQIMLRQFELRPTPDGLERTEHGVFFAPRETTESKN